MYTSARNFADYLGIRLPLICYNGAMIRTWEGEVLVHTPLDLGVARRLLDIFRQRDMYVQSYVGDELLIRDQDNRNFIEYSRFFGIQGRAVGNSLYEPETAPTKLLAKSAGIEHSHEIIEELSELFGDELYVTSSNSDFVEMMNPRANKGECLAKVAELLGVPLANVMALGDGENDIEMIKRAGVGIATANARESVRLAADEVAPSNDDCGVAWALEKYILRKTAQDF
jgi:Cof subfamily protein (haloacid dehalogenase superfamily)